MEDDTLNVIGGIFDSEMQPLTCLGGYTAKCELDMVHLEREEGEFPFSQERPWI